MTPEITQDQGTFKTIQRFDNQAIDMPI